MIVNMKKDMTKTMNNFDEFYGDDKIIKGYEQDLESLKEKLNDTNNEIDRQEYLDKIEMIENVLNCMKG